MGGEFVEAVEAERCARQSRPSFKGLKRYALYLGSDTGCAISDIKQVSLGDELTVIHPLGKGRRTLPSLVEIGTVEPSQHKRIAVTVAATRFGC